MTRGLQGSNSNPPHWSHWFRLVDTRRVNGTAVMQGPDGKPLLVLAREGEGRVALLLSDHIWLWARGYEGGGPHLDLLRRLSHWLMKQPDLEEEALRLFVHGRDLTVQRQTMADSVNQVTLTSPSGKTQTLISSGRAGRVALDAHRQRARAVARHRRQAHRARQCRPRQSARIPEVTSTTDVLRPLANATGGDVRRLAAGDSFNVPRVVPVRSSHRPSKATTGSG